MNNNENYVFNFGGNEEQQNANNFNYSSINGLGESNYENEDLFPKEEVSSPVEQSNVSSNVTTSDLDTNFDTSNFYGSGYSSGLDKFSNSQFQNNDDSYGNFNAVVEEPKDIDLTSPLDEYVSNQEVNPVESQTESAESNEIPETLDKQSFDTLVEEPKNETNVEEDLKEESFNSSETLNSDQIEASKAIDDTNADSLTNFEINDIQPYIQQNDFEVSSESEINNDSTYNQEENNSVDSTETFGGAPIDELNKLTEYKEEPLEETNLDKLFDKMSSNVQEAYDIFKKNSEMKDKIDRRFDELKALQLEISKIKKAQLDEIDAYKEEVLNKLTDTKKEVENRLNTLKEYQANLEKDKKEFEEFKEQEKIKIKNVEKDVQSAYDDRKEELNRIEDTLRKQKDSLDEERTQLNLDKIKLESDKNDLANNILKFNEIVGSFTSGMNDIEE